MKLVIHGKFFAPMESKLERTSDLHRGLAGEAVRYGIAGAAIAGLYAGVLLATSTVMAVPAQAANAIGFLTALIAGYVVHSMWSFDGHNRRAHRFASARFLVVNLAGYALNSFWVWIFVDQLGKAVAVSVVPIVTVTPVLMFAVNRSWTFASRA